MVVQKNITMPRVGLVRYNTVTRRKIKTTHLITTGLVFLTLSVMVLGANRFLTEPTWRFLPKWVSDLDADMIFALVIIAIFWVIAYAVGVT